MSSSSSIVALAHPRPDAQEILLLRIRPPQGGAAFWITPGGGLDTGETAESGLRRELKEELGLEHFVMGPLVWRRQHTFDLAGKRICQRIAFAGGGWRSWPTQPSA